MTIDLEEKALFALRMIVKNPKATWNCPEQKNAVMATLERKTDVFIIMATGSGKSLVALIPPMVEKNQVTVLVLPLVSLMTDYQRRLDAIPLNYETYTNANRGKLEGSANLVLVTLDMTRSKHWTAALTGLHQWKTVARLIFDEAHLGITHADFRRACQDLDNLRIFSMQFGVMSATITPLMEVHIKESFGLGSTTTCIRTPTDRPELQYIIKTPSSFTKVAQSTQELYNHHRKNFRGQDRALIFVPYVDSGKKLAELLECTFYHAKTPSTTRSQYYKDWISGKSKVMVCSSAFSAGNDYPHVRLVIHTGTPLEMIDLTQELSRAGRDKALAYCYILPTISKAKPVLDSSKPDFSGKLAAWELAISTTECIRFLITNFNDGVGVLCKDSSKASLCSRCQQSPAPRKRKAAATADPFAQSAEDVKKRKVMKAYQDSAYIEAFQRALSKFSNTCAFCGVFDKVTEYHPITRCRTLHNDVENISFGSYQDWKQKIYYGPNHPSAVCFHCHIPQCDDLLHEEFTPGAKNCTNPDVVGPVAFAVYCLPNLKSGAEEALGTKWKSIDGYLKWLNASPVTGHKTNMTAVFLWYANKK